MLLKPSYHTGFAPRDGVPLYPNLWRGCVGAWCPTLGPSGTQLHDWSGFENHGTLTSMDPATDWVVGSNGHEIELDGTLDHVQTQWVPEATSTGITFLMWCRPTSSNGYYNMAMSYGPLSSVPEMRFRESTGKMEIINRSNNAGATDAVATNDGKLHCYIGTGDLATLSIWRDGVKTSSATAHTISSSTPLRLGRRADDYGGNFCLFGTILEASVWDRVLIDSECLMLSQRPGIMYELTPRRRASTIEDAASVKYWLFRRSATIIGGGVS